MVKVYQLSLDAQFNATLDWGFAREEALRAIGSGYQILWSLKLGIFDQLQKPLSHSAQFLNLGLALEHFHKTIWNEFHRFSMGVSLYEGPLDFSHEWKWSVEHRCNLQNWLKDHFKTVSELASEIETKIESFDAIDERTLQGSASGELLLKIYLRDVASEYLEQLALKLPVEVTPFLYLTKLPQTMLEKMILTHPGAWRRIQFYSPFTLRKWETYANKPQAVCLPIASCVLPSLLFSFKTILEKANFKWIAEEDIITAWNELDELHYSPSATSYQGNRMLQGFQAAGGKLIKIQ